METNEEVVLQHLNGNRFLGKKPLAFKSFMGNHDTLFNTDIQQLLEIEDVKKRVYKILQIARAYSTYNENGIYQCRNGANRSTADIWRIYKKYFGDIDIFSIMRALYELTLKDKQLGTYRCPTVRKRVFWLDNNTSFYVTRDTETPAELGVSLRYWENIGLNEQTT